MSRERAFSIITDDLEHCYIHKKFLGVEVKANHLHHCAHGVANRKIADKEGLVCGLCYQCHSALHDKNYHDLDLEQDAERAWLKHNNATVEDWIKLIGKNFI